MKVLPFLLICYLFSSLCQAQSLESATELSYKEKLLTTRDSKKFEQLLAEGKKQKQPAQLLFEAEFLFSIDTDDENRIAKLTQSIPQLKKDFDLKKSEIFASKEDWLAVTEFAYAVQAHLNGDDKSFEQHVKQAFWLSPEQAPLLASYIENYKIKKLKKNFQLAPNALVKDFKDVDIPLNQLMKNKDGIVFYFFNPWSRQTIENIPHLKKFHAKCEQLKLYHIHYNTESSDDVKEDLADYQKQVPANVVDLWSQTNKGDKLIEALRIKRTPTIVIINKLGKVTFHDDLSAFLRK